ncbi:AAA family ATPase [Agrobacterium sp. MS2]|uniref:McrB family protein n=1 Tax=Agrobacterium sp. MS2 TaxID=1345498 RepID=UPI000DC00D48|nr:AAA family ATPase [Agrobacterium sp. MS2]RAL97729.1 EVE domain-containing protein [Agrobacterium sp. MS2]
MAVYNPHFDAEPIYQASKTWADRCLLNNGSIFSELSLWTPSLLDELDLRFVQNPDEGEGDFIAKLRDQLGQGSSECKMLMAEAIWLLMLFQSSANIGVSKKREAISKVWSWSGRALPDDNAYLSTEVLSGLGSAGTAYNTQRWRELSFLISVSRSLKALNGSDKQRLMEDGWAFDTWLSELPGARNRQLTQILPHLIFPAQFERISSEKDKRLIISAFRGMSDRDARRLGTVAIDRTLLEIRRELEAHRDSEVDFYLPDLRSAWRKEAVPEKAIPVVETPVGILSADNALPLNLILYGPPGTGKTHRLQTRYFPAYSDGSQQRFDFITFHQSYAYEDFVEGIRPTLHNNQVVFDVKDGSLLSLAERARKQPDVRFALFIDEINRGNISKIFGELITLIEPDKRASYASNGDLVSGIEVKLPYSGRRFGLPTNIDIIGTMNTADRSIALLDTALRRRFQFEEMMPDPTQVMGKADGIIDDGDGGEIDLRQLLAVINARLTVLLHRDQTIGHSYLTQVRSIDQLRRVLAREIIPLLQEFFYDDWQQIRLIFADQSVVDSEYQIIRAAPTLAEDLFPSADAVELSDRPVFEIAAPDDISPDAIRKIYDAR